MEKYAKRQKPVSIFRVSDVLAAHHQVPHSERAEDINALQVRLSCLSAAIDDAMHRPARRTRSSSSTRREASLKLERETMGAPSRSPTAAKRKLSPSPSPPRLQQQQQQAERSPSRLSVPTSAALPPSQSSYYASSNSVGGLAVPLVHGVPSSRIARSRSPQPSLPSTMSPITSHHHQHLNNRERTVSPMTVSPKKQQQRPSSSSSSRRVLSPPAEERTRLDELLEEERMVKARIETAKRLEEEKLDLLRRQQRLLDLDKERRRVEELRRQEERNEQERLENEQQRQRLNRSESAASNSSVVMDPNSATQHASPSSTVLGYTGRNTSRSPSPLGYRRSSLPSSASVATVTDARRAAYDHLATKGMVVIVMPSATERTPCWMSIAGSTLLLSPIPNSTPIGGEIHHFPLADATILYHGGMLVQRTWPPRKVHVCGVVIGNRARSILIAKGCIPAASGEREIAELDNPYSLHVVVGAPSPYDTDSTLLVLHFTDRSQFATALLGLHCALWPNGRPALTRGRLLWMLASQLLLQRRRLWHTHVAAPASSYLPPQEPQQKSSFSAFAHQRHPPPPPPSAFTAAAAAGSSKPPSPMYDAVRTPSHRFSVAGIFANQPPPPPPPPPASLLPPQRVAPMPPLQQQQPWMESTPPTSRSVSPQPTSVGTFFPRSQPVKGGAAPLHFHRQPSATLRYDYGKQ